MKFFGREVSDTGCEILIKVGSRFADPANLGHAISWRDGQIVAIRPLGYHTGRNIGYCRVLLKFPNIDYTTLGGRWEQDWKKPITTPTLIDKVLHTVDANGKYSWEAFYSKGVRKTRDWFFDFKDFQNKHLINASNRKNIYDYSHKTILEIASLHSLDALLKQEDQDTRLDPSKLLQHASITTGTHSIGSGLDYDDIVDFEAAIGAQLTGDLTGEHNNEETTTTAAITFDTDSNTHLLKLTAQSGDEHNGGAYGNGARISFAAGDGIYFDETTAGHLDDVEVSNLAFSAANNLYCIGFMDGADNGSFLANRNLLECAGNNTKGINIDYTCINAKVINNIIYDAYAEGIVFASSDRTYYIANNTVANCATGIRQDNAVSATNTTVKNNLCQDNTNDYVDDGAGFGTHSKNISEDASSPDAAYQSKDLHTNSVFLNYAGDDYRLDENGDATNLAIVDDGDDLSGVFTDDVQGQARSTWYIGASEILAAGTEYQRAVVGALSVMSGTTARKLSAERAIGGAI